MMVSFEIGILPNRPFRECVDLCVAAEKLGFGGVWVADSQSVMRDAYALLSVVGAKTDRIRIASGITNARTRHLAVLAASWATLDELSGGRAVMGIRCARVRSAMSVSSPTGWPIWKPRSTSSAY